MNKSNTKKSKDKKKLLQLMFLRVVLITFLLGIASYMQIKSKSLPDESLTLIFYIIISYYILTFVYLALLQNKQFFKSSIYLQIFIDILLITSLVYATGGVRSIYSVLYQMVIIYSAFFVTLKGCIVSATLSSLFYTTLITMEYFKIAGPIFNNSWDTYTAGEVFSQLFTYVVSFYLVAFLVSLIEKKEQIAKLLLAKKSSEFREMDMFNNSIIESIDIGIITTDLTGEINSINKTARSITGLSFSDVYQKHIIDIFPEFYDKFNKSYQRENKPFETEIDYEIDDEELILHISISPLINANSIKVGEILMIRNITELKIMEKNSEKRKQMALIGEMAAGLAHEVRNPLASLSGSIQLLQKNLGLSGTNKRLMNIVLRGRDHLENLVKDFLLLSRQKTDKSEFNLRDIINEVIESLKYGKEWDEKIKIRNIIKNKRPIYGNKIEIKEVIWNLVNNSIHSMADGGVLTIRVQDIFIKDMSYISLQVSDTGTGIDNNDLHDLFKPFFTTKERGTGLGLAIVNRITESHGGKISVKSTVGKGTCFTILLP